MLESEAFAILNLPKNATPKEIKKAWRQISFRFHESECDLNNNTDYNKALEAYQILSSPGRELVDNLEEKMSVLISKLARQSIANTNQNTISVTQFIKMIDIYNCNTVFVKTDNHGIVEVKPYWNSIGFSTIKLNENTILDLNLKPEDSDWKISKQDLCFTCYISPLESIFGFTKPYIHVDGTRFKLISDKMIDPGSELIIPNMGLLIYPDNPSCLDRGNLVINYEVSKPNVLTEEIKRKLGDSTCLDISRH